MKSRLVMSLVMTMFVLGNVFAGTPIEDGLLLKGEFSQISGRSVRPQLPVTASFEGNILYVTFSQPVGEVSVVVKDASQKDVYSSSENVAASGQRIAISVEDYEAGTYTLEVRNSRGGYVYGEFALM